MLRFTEKTLNTLLALAIILTLFTSSLSARSNSVDRYGQSVKVYYFNGMNTSIYKARDERDRIIELIKATNPRKTRNFKIELAYTSTSGIIIDASTIPFYRYQYTKYETDANYCLHRRTNGCYRTSWIQYGYYKVKRQLAKDNHMSYILPRNSIKTAINPKSVFISYSRGNIVANAVQDFSIEGSKASRINIASPDRHDYGKLFNLTSDYVINKLSPRSGNYNPDYYYFKLSRKDKRIYKYGRSWHNIFKFNEKFFGAWKIDGHSLINSYLHINGLNGPSHDITREIIKQYNRKGGK